MDVFPIVNDDVLFAFEIRKTFVTLRRVAAILRSVEGIDGVRVRRLFAAGHDVHVRFRYQDQDYMVWEPFGDSSMYWIGPEEDSSQPVDISNIERAFRNHVLPMPVRALDWLG